MAEEEAEATEAAGASGEEEGSGTLQRRQSAASLRPAPAVATCCFRAAHGGR